MNEPQAIDMNEPQAIDIPLRFVLQAEGSPTIACPVCACQWVHIGSVHVRQQNTLTVCCSNKTELLPADAGKEGRRGSEVLLVFYCEDGHAFAYKWQFRKGVTYVDLVAAEMDEEEFADSPELWRD